MANGKSTWKYNKLLTGRRNYFAYGSQATTQGTGIDLRAPDSTWYTGPEKNKLGIVIGGYTNNPIKVDPGTKTYPEIRDMVKNASGVDKGSPKDSTTRDLLTNIGIQLGGKVANTLFSNGMQSTAGNVMSGIGDIASSIVPGTLGSVLGAGFNAVAGGINGLFGYKLNKENIANVESNIDDLNNFQSNASDFDSLVSNWSSAPVGMNFKNSYIGKEGLLSNKVTNIANDLRRRQDIGVDWTQRTLANNAENITQDQMSGLLGNYAALGGPLLYSKGGSIHIKPENRGKFTETKRRTGKTTEELTHSSNPLTRKRAIFALNSRHWNKHSNGGYLEGKEYDLDELEIKRLIDAGYEIEYL